MNRNKYVNWTIVVVLLILASSCSQTRYSSRNYVKGHTISQEKKITKQSDEPVIVETVAELPNEPEKTEVPIIKPKTEENVTLFTPKANPVAKTKAKLVRNSKLKELVKSNSMATVDPDQKSDGGGLRFIGWFLIILGLVILIFASIIVGILLMLLGLLFVVVGKK